MILASRDARWSSIASIGVTAGLTLFLYLTGFFVVFTPLPLAFQFTRRSPWSAVVSFFLSASALFLFYRLPHSPLLFLPFAALHSHLEPLQIMGLSLIYFFYYSCIGFAIGVASRLMASLEKSFFAILLATLLIPGILLTIVAQGVGIHLLDEMRGIFQWLMNQMAQFQEESKVGSDEIAYLKQYGPMVVSQILSIMPALWINLSLVIISLNILFLRRLSPLPKPFSHWTSFPLWRLVEGWVWLPISVGTLFFLNEYLMQNAYLEAVLLNILLVLAMVYFFQGLSIVFFYFRRVSPMLRLLAYLVMILFLQVIGIVIAIVGIFDFWFDFRKAKKIV